MAYEAAEGRIERCNEVKCRTENVLQQLWINTSSEQQIIYRDIQCHQLFIALLMFSQANTQPWIEHIRVYCRNYLTVFHTEQRKIFNHVRKIINNTSNVTVSIICTTKVLHFSSKIIQTNKFINNSAKTLKKYKNRQLFHPMNENSFCFLHYFVFLWHVDNQQQWKYKHPHHCVISPVCNTFINKDLLWT